MMASPTKQKQSSRLHRISSFLPRLSTISKLQQDPQRPPVLRKELPAPRERSPQPPSRSAPQLPLLEQRSPTPPSPSMNQTKKLQKHNSPAHAKAPPRRPPPHLTPDGRQPASAESLERPRGHALSPPSTRPDFGAVRSVSAPWSTSRPTSNHSEGEGHNPSKIRKSWLGGKRSRDTSGDLGYTDAQAWVNAGPAKIEYNVNHLYKGEKVPELWNDAADTLVYLLPRETGRGPQFRVPSSTLASSQLLRNLLREIPQTGQSSTRSLDVQSSHTVNDAAHNVVIRGFETPPYTPKISTTSSHAQSVSDGSKGSIRSFIDGPRLYYLYFPVDLDTVATDFSTQDTQRLVEARNLFALLTRQPLIAIKTCPTNYDIFLAIASLLRRLQFSSEDGRSFGTAVNVAFTLCLKDMTQIADCRESRIATLKALVLAEAMKSTELYNEAFAHAVGKYDEIRSLKSPLYNNISPLTRNRLEKASLDLRYRQRSVNDRLIDFEFPSLFAGIAASTTSAESKTIRFKAWKTSFLAIRKQIMTYYKDLHGQWPPKASSKKNSFVESGLNRLVLKGIYSDFCDLYDLLADRQALTTRVYNEDGVESTDVPLVSAAVRKLLDEYDRSSPPVQPPIPFDVPLIPTVNSLEPGFQSLSPKDQHKHLSRKLKDYETRLVLAKSHNLDADYQRPFLAMFKAFELKEARSKTSIELSEQRHGYWIFLYALLQSLPLLTTDAPGLQYSDGVEYFLCQASLGNLPWIEDQSQVRMSWFGVQGGQQIVSLPSDLVNHGVEATYHRSHCWTIAQLWIGADVHSSDIIDGEVALSPLSPPPGFSGGGFDLRPSVRNHQRASSASASQRGSSGGLSPGPQPHSGRSDSRQSQRSSIALGLERLPLESDGSWSPMGSSRGTSPTNDSSRRGHSSAGLVTPPQATKSSTFDDILSSMVQQQGVKKEKKRK